MGMHQTHRQIEGPSWWLSLAPSMMERPGLVTSYTYSRYSLHCSSYLTWFNQFYMKDPER